MSNPSQPQCIAFDGMRRIASGSLTQVVLAAKTAIDRSEHTSVLIFDMATSDRIDIDFHGTTAEVSERLRHIGNKTGVAATARATQAAQTAQRANTANASDGDAPQTEAPRGPGRPKLGVVAREVTLLPRHWDWLNVQPGGASVALRKLVEEARRVNGGKDRVRQAQEAAYRFLSPMAGHLAGFEEATRALFAADAARFHALVEPWPGDVRDHATHLAAQVFEPRW